MTFVDNLQAAYHKGQAYGKIVIVYKAEQDVSEYLTSVQASRDQHALLFAQGDWAAGLIVSFANGILSCFEKEGAA